MVDMLGAGTPTVVLPTRKKLSPNGTVVALDIGWGSRLAQKDCRMHGFFNSLF
jgi:hypothetical protein